MPLPSLALGRYLLLAASALLTTAAAAHEVAVSSQTQPAAVVELRYADGQPLAFEAYEIFRPGDSSPSQLGHTDGNGRIVFLAGEQATWRIKVFTADGHGIDQQLHVPTSAAQPAGDVSPARGLLLAAGIGIVFGLFGVVQLFLRRKQA